MEGELVERPSVLGVEESAPSYTKLFWDWLPYYMAMGMTYEEFWNCDPQLYQVYRKLYETKREQENHRLWLEGMYVYQAILLTAPRLNSLKPRKPEEYPDKPFGISKKVEEPEDGFGKMKAWMEKVNKHYE